MFSASTRNIAFAFICFSLILSTLGCGGYGEVSPTAYEYAKALYSITNRKAQDRLELVDAQIDTAHDEGKLTDQESQWLLDIVEEANGGDWQSANRASRRMMEDQVASAN